MGHKDLRLGQIVYILVFYNISFSWLLPLDGFQFIFLLRDSENDLLDEFPFIFGQNNEVRMNESRFARKFDFRETRAF